MVNKNLTILFIILALSLIVASLWDNFPIVKDSVNFILNPTLGYFIRLNVFFGFIMSVIIISFILTIAQKYLTDQEELKKIKKEQKILQEEMKKYRNHPEKLLEFQKKQLEFIPKTFDLTMKPLLYTSIPIVLFFRWFNDQFVDVFGKWWILWYILASIFFSTIFRKVFDVA